MDRLEALSEWLRRIEADIWVLTESSMLLSPGDGYQAVTSRGTDRDGEADERWVTIWSRLPVVEELATADPVRTACVRLAQPGGGSLVVYGSVLPWLGSKWREHAATDGQAFAAALAAQAGDWRRIRSEHAGAELCVAGDLNQDLRGRHYYGSGEGRTALARELEDCELLCITGGERDPVDRLTGGERASIDHICFSKNLAQRATAPSSWPEGSAPAPALSDHFGVWVDVAYDEPAHPAPHQP